MKMVLSTITLNGETEPLLSFSYWSTEIPEFLSEEECDHIIKLAKENGLAMSIAGFDMKAYEGDLDEDMAEAGNSCSMSISVALDWRQDDARKIVFFLRERFCCFAKNTWRQWLQRVQI